MAVMHSNPCKSLQKLGDGTLDNVLTDRIIVFSVRGKASTRIQPTEPSDLAINFGIVLEAARHTLECTTHRGLQTVLHPYLIRLLRTNERQLRSRRMRHDFFGDTLLTGTKSNHGNKYA